MKIMILNKFYLTYLNNSTQSQAHLQVSQANSRPKPAKELAFPITRTDRKDVAKMNDKIIKDENSQLVTKVTVAQAPFKARH